MISRGPFQTQLFCDSVIFTNTGPPFKCNHKFERKLSYIVWVFHGLKQRGFFSFVKRSKVHQTWTYRQKFTQTICSILLSLIPSLKGNKAVFSDLKGDVLFEGYSRATAGKESLGFTEFQTLYITAVNPERLLIQEPLLIVSCGKNIQTDMTLKLIVPGTCKSLTDFHFNRRLKNFITSMGENKICHRTT